MASTSDFHTAYSGTGHDPGSDAVHSAPSPIFAIASQLRSQGQIRDFELLRLARFVLKLHKLEQSPAETFTDLLPQERLFQSRLLHHVIFQQVLTLTALNARDEALRLIAASHTL
jgi:hypothetical protein